MAIDESLKNKVLDILEDDPGGREFLLTCFHIVVPQV